MLNPRSIRRLMAFCSTRERATRASRKVLTMRDRATERKQLVSHDKATRVWCAYDTVYSALIYHSFSLDDPPVSSRWVVARDDCLRELEAL